jgi:hypothetical protein
MSKQNLIILTTKVKDKEQKLTGRFLGFIKDDEFNALYASTNDVASKLESKATQPIMDVVPKFDNMDGYRLVMTVRKVDEKTVIRKTLFVTEGLDMITEVKPGIGTEGGSVVLQAGGNSDITVQETE